MTDKTLNQLAADAIAALAAFNAENARQSKAWQANVKANGYAAHFRDAPQIADHLQMKLLEEIVFFDDDAKGTLDEMRFESDEQPTFGRVRMSDVEFDYAAAIGAM